MNTLEAVARAQMAQGQPIMVFDWDKAARLILEKKPKIADAGLLGDYEYTRGQIYCAHFEYPFVECYTYLASNWAKPMLILDDSEEIECFVINHPEWDTNTKWPESALKIMKGK